MKTVNLSLKISLTALTAFSMTACMGPSGSVCTDRLCLTLENLSINQTDVTGVAVQSSGFSTQGLLDNVLSLTPTLTLVGTLAPPLVNGASVQASDVAVSGNKVYVAYNTAGNTQAGAIDVVDITNPYALNLASQALYPTMDIHKVFVNSGRLYAAGATSDNGGGANLQKISLDGSGKLTSTVASVFLRRAADTNPAFAGTSVVASGNNVYALSGNNGGLTILNASDLSTRSFTALPEARDITINGAGNALFAVVGKTSGAEAGIKQFDLTGTAVPAGNLTLPNAQIDEGKSTILTGNVVHIATAGYGGARLICLSSGTTLGTAVNPAISGLTTAEQTANAATFGAGYMFVANGEAGVSIYSVNTPLVPVGCNLVTITYLGRFSLGTDASVNNVFFTNGFLVAATGEKGFKIIKVTTSLLSGLLQAL